MYRLWVHYQSFVLSFVAAPTSQCCLIGYNIPTVCQSPLRLVRKPTRSILDLEDGSGSD